MTCSHKAAGRTYDTTKAQNTNIHDIHVGDDDTSETVSSIQEHRQRLLSDGCREFAHVMNKSHYWEMYYDDQMDYIWCLVSKASCTSWKCTLMMLTGKLTEFQRPEQLPWHVVHMYNNSDKYVDRLHKKPKPYRDWRFHNYFTFMFVREPLERLVSAYRDKLLENPWNLGIDGRIAQKYRPHEYNVSVKRYSITFTEFIRYVLDERAAGRELDRHWIPQSELCRVCKHRYDFIGHYETLHKDAEFVVDKLKSRIQDSEQRRRVANITFPADSGHRKSSDFLQQMYSTVPADYIQALYQLYAVDYALFEFKHPLSGYS